MNTTKLKSVLCRAAAGEELTIGFLGGSITQGSLTTQPKTRWTASWKRRRFSSREKSITMRSKRYMEQRDISE